MADFTKDVAKAVTEMLVLALRKGTIYMFTPFYRGMIHQIPSQ